MNSHIARTSVLLGVGLVLILASVAHAEILLTAGDFHTPRPDLMTRGYRGILFTLGESWEPSATTIPFPDELRGVPEIRITVYFIPEDPHLVGDVCLCARISSDSPGEEAFVGEDYCSNPQQVDPEWGDDQLGSSEIITPGYLRSEGELLHIAIYRDINESFQDTYPGAIWFSAIKVEAGTPSGAGEAMLEPRPRLTTRPTPFGTDTEIQYTLPGAANVSVHIFDLQGRLVEQIDPGFQVGGRHTLSWGARGCDAGVYLVKLLVNGTPSVAKTVKID
ncbi:MAG: T9SS type A sorting domain-containing protein [Candidatus Eisenbacteria sp.]|nr:T9SS type A sorting domain-containing protein [Candidatus Eisenbacteria bacterium]